jgi:hypothetical protein
VLAKPTEQIPASFLSLLTDPSLKVKTFQLTADPIKRRRKTVKFLGIRRHIALGKRPLPR